MLFYFLAELRLERRVQLFKLYDSDEENSPQYTPKKPYNINLSKQDYPSCNSQMHATNNSLKIYFCLRRQCMTD